jgi:hypothetical protein
VVLLADGHCRRARRTTRLQSRTSDRFEGVGGCVLGDVMRCEHGGKCKAARMPGTAGECFDLGRGNDECG